MKYLLLCFVLLLNISCKKEGAPDVPVVDEVPEGTTLLRQGSFQNGPYGQVSGAGKVLSNTDNTFSVVLDSFMTNNGPDLYVYLSKEIMPVKFVEVGKLKATSGRQVYRLNSLPDLQQYKYICIHCKEYNHLFGYALLP